MYTVVVAACCLLSCETVETVPEPQFRSHASPEGPEKRKPSFRLHASIVSRDITLNCRRPITTSLLLLSVVAHPGRRPCDVLTVSGSALRLRVPSQGRRRLVRVPGAHRLDAARLAPGDQGQGLRGRSDGVQPEHKSGLLGEKNEASPGVFVLGVWCSMGFRCYLLARGNEKRTVGARALFWCLVVCLPRCLPS